MRILFILIGTILMVLISIFKFDSYNINRWKAICLSFILTICGVIGAYLLYLIENGEWGGISFYGSVLLIPILLLPVSVIFKISYRRLLDFSVPQICIMLAVMKVLCYIEGCCSGILLYIDNSGNEVYFPSQIIEILVAIFIMVLILFIDNKKYFINAHYALFFIIYGFLRLILNFFRANLTVFFWVVPAGVFWSLISIIIGSIWMSIHLINQND